ncbi:sensor histidine kinase [Actinoplanes flavus]|uniref:histidine kinase n=1 Tax=Actinoplanes flavus TaxID=2820290 RepID=A0ABS3UZA4_9ACTN|nr:ATP-binding protein [Actinoplanes flavus]MBO3743913.1 HAMP domain-containing protein [Actinoplanes flavus]
MSFRLRVLLLTAFLVLTSSAATAWLTLRQANRQLTDTVAAGQREVTAITGRLTGYGLAHGSWDGVERSVADLSGEFGQRIRLVTEDGLVVADSDLLSGRQARAVAGEPTVVDPRPPMPELTLPTASARAGLIGRTITAYRDGWAFADCLAQAGAEVRQRPGADGVPVFDGDGAAAVVTACRERTRSSTEQARAAGREAYACTETGDDHTCLRTLFARQVATPAAEPLRLYIGARDEVPYRLSGGSIALVAGAVVLVATGTALLLTRRVLRPISALTTAARRLGAGARSERVAITGRDELTELGRTFNHMAASLDQSERQQRQLIADIAHELRTPLQNLRGYLEALADGVLEPDPELFASLHEEALLHQRIIDDLQDLALAEAGVLTYHRGVVDLAELAETCRTAHGAVAEAAGLDLTVDAPAEMPVYADPDRLRQVFGNLIRNAIAATPPNGRIRLEVAGAGDRAVVRISDTGKGIAETDLPHVFDRFWRADAARRRGAGGSGLGLAIVSQIIADHGGTISVTSEIGRGTTFTVTLPVSSDPGRR